jgi:GNAT superfamily N-acetyltransferase/uncharacterized protein YozE (UPF0346 family)
MTKRYYFHGDKIEDELEQYYCAYCDMFADEKHFSEILHSGTDKERYDRSVKGWKILKKNGNNSFHRLDNALNLFLKLPKPKNPKTSSFYRWIIKQKNRNDSIGDLSNDIRQDKLFPLETNSLKQIRKYLWNNSTCDEVIEALEKAHMEFKSLENKKIMSKTANGYIRFATETDMEIIHNWLVVQDENGVHGTFLCNWNLTEEVYCEGNIIVYIDNQSNEPVAYMWTDFGIIEVREDKRGQGIGRVLTEFAIKYALKWGEVAIRIECAPLSSIPFWNHMGFKFYTNKHAYILLDKKNSLPENGKAIKVDIKFYPECKKWESETAPLETFSPTAVKTPEGIIYFKNRLSIFSGNTNRWKYDPVVEINVDGKELYLDKAKYPQAHSLGVNMDGHSFSIDCLYIERS